MRMAPYKQLQRSGSTLTEHVSHDVNSAVLLLRHPLRLHTEGQGSDTVVIYCKGHVDSVASVACESARTTGNVRPARLQRRVETICDKTCLMIRVSVRRHAMLCCCSYECTMTRRAVHARLFACWHGPYQRSCHSLCLRTLYAINMLRHMTQCPHDTLSIDHVHHVLERSACVHCRCVLTLAL
eukprot:jgi/Chlat1/3834/Chrsp26S04055